jgi:PilZ domain-containing protein
VIGSFSHTRRDERYPLSGSVQIAWDSDSGGYAYASARCLDISAHGMGFESPNAIPVRAYLAIRSKIPDLVIPGHGNVRYCTRSRSGNFRVGVQFTDLVVYDKIPEMQKAPSLSSGPPVTGLS